MNVRHRLRVTIVLGAVLLGVGTVVGAALTEPRDFIRVSASFAEVRLATLLAGSDAVAVVRFTGESTVRWNSADNKRWEPEVGSGVGAWIYRDDMMDVVRVIRGSLPGRLVVRGVGGTVGNVTMVHESQTEWLVDRPYLLFLRREQTPTQEGWEEAWTVTWLEHGAFEERAGGWQNGSQTLVVDESIISEG